MKIKMNKYYGLLFFCTVIYLSLFLTIVVMSFIYALCMYVSYDVFLYKCEYVLLALKISLLAIPASILMWYLECRRLGIKIFGK